MKPIDANHNQSFENASIFILFIKQRITTGIAPRKILKNAKWCRQNDLKGDCNETFLVILKHYEN